MAGLTPKEIVESQKYTDMHKLYDPVLEDIDRIEKLEKAAIQKYQNLLSHFNAAGE